jgi:hypothetical protein
MPKLGASDCHKKKKKTLFNRPPINIAASNFADKQDLVSLSRFTSCKFSTIMISQFPSRAANMSKSILEWYEEIMPVPVATRSMA